ncbi:glycosyltransferase family A protein [Nodosilinea sp. P-1105]|uniref:glycosyltransferase family A protein n=1 Tax=Nodosilinea sp. P-1105 TaxID=2546229 RepID=UPI00146DE047|nr:glycosyltransferase family A protein [Nodosilinea sp. P-1105]NMF82944.1 glycosyltransferase family 2 protein [Nodosilinea sp. P-1105]
MIVFIIPVKHHLVAHSWTDLSKYFTRTLRSVCRQSSENFQVVVVCNQKPVTDFDHPNVHYHHVNFPVPNSAYTSKMDDRSKRVVAGLVYAKQMNPSYIMLVDADDCISKNIASFVDSNELTNGWFVDSGYEYVEGLNKVYFRRKGFNRLCGTCNIINYKLFKVPDSLPTYDQIAGYDRFLTGHSYAQIDLSDRGYPIAPLPFPGCIYVRDNIGESVTLEEALHEKIKRSPKEIFHGLKRTVLSPLNSRKLTENFKDEFSFYKI